MSDLPRRKHTDVMSAHLQLDAARVADIGCGEGTLLRFMARRGAEALGIECGAEQLARARAAEAAGGERYIAARGEALPLADATFDVVIFFNSLHHVPVEAQGAALAEATRVLRPGGTLYVMEPLAEGAYFELMKPIDDETYVRAKAYDALQAAQSNGHLSEDLEERYAAPFKYESFAACKANSVAIDPVRRAAFEAHEAALAKGFEAVAEQRDGAYWFHQPSRLNLLRRRPA